MDRLTAHDLGSREMHTRGQRPTSRVAKTTPFMQGFQTTRPKPAAFDSSTIDFFFFPPVPEPPPANPFAKLRVPLLPDNYSPDRSANSAHAVEAVDEAVPRPEISVIASHPEFVLPAAMSEVVGNEGLDIDLGFLTSGFSGTSSQPASSMITSKQTNVEGGVFKELWNGVVDDIFGSKPTHKAAV
jgi:hypothetical protein